MRNIVLAAAIAGGAAIGGFAFATPASALPMVNPLGADAGQGPATTVAWYCDKRGHCIQAPRRGYVVKRGWVPSCGRGYWNGYRCVGPRVVVKPSPRVVVKPVPGVKVKIK